MIVRSGARRRLGQRRRESDPTVRKKAVEEQVRKLTFVSFQNKE
jgi:hypothetical protein